MEAETPVARAKRQRAAVEKAALILVEAYAGEPVSKMVLTITGPGAVVHLNLEREMGIIQFGKDGKEGYLQAFGEHGKILGVDGNLLEVAHVVRIDGGCYHGRLARINKIETTVERGTAALVTVEPVGQEPAVQVWVVEGPQRDRCPMDQFCLRAS